MNLLESALLEKFRREREDLQEKSKKSLGYLSQKLDNMENKIDDLKSETDGIKEIRSEIEDLKEMLKKNN